MRRPRPNGRVLHLEVGDYRMAVTTVGATLASLTHRGADLVHPLDSTRLPLAYEGKVLAPWPNRIRDGRWTWNGEPLQVPITEVSTGNALHGLASWLDWQVGARSASDVSLHASLAAQPGYPFPLELEAHYHLMPDGLRLVLRATNDGVAPAPVGLGFHPYLTVGGRPIDSLTLEFAAATGLLVDGRGLPAGEVAVPGGEWDFAGGRAVGKTSIDNPFPMAGPWVVRLGDPETGAGVELASDAAWLHLYTGELLGRRGLAVEPTTCPPEAFNSGVDLTVLAPGEVATLECVIRAAPLRT